MIALLLALAASPQTNVKPLLFECAVSDVNGSQRALVIQARGKKRDANKFHDPSNLLDLYAPAAYSTTDFWPSYWEYSVSSYFMKGPHEERLGTHGGWMLRMEPAQGSKFKATITINDYGAEYTNNNKDSGFTLKGNCTWREGRGALATYSRLTK